MTRNEILGRISSLLGDIVDDEELALQEDTVAEDVPDWDSTNHVRLIVAIESEFGIRFESDEISAPENVGQLVDLIQKKQAA